MKTISIVTPCYNEEENIEEVYKRVKGIIANKLSRYKYEHIFIDNASTDNTVNILKAIASEDQNVKVIVNSRNFGWLKSPTHGIFQATGDAIILLVADLQDPPEIIPDFISKWEDGNDTVMAVKKSSKENSFMFFLRKSYYKLLAKLSDIKIIQNCTGFGLYDKKIINAIKNFNDPYPFFRGMVIEAGFNISTIEYNQPKRKKGVSAGNFYKLYDYAMLGIMNNSKVPLRIATFIGLIFSTFSTLVGIGYFIAKLIFWNSMTVGIAPLIIMSSIMFSTLIFFLGIIGEYIGAIYTQVINRPLVIEKERINFMNK